MPDVLIYGDTITSPELRHEVPLVVPDPFLYLESGDQRVAVIHALEFARVRDGAPNLEVIPTAALGEDDLYAAGKRETEVELELISRACREVGVTSAAVPATFPLEKADFLRQQGIEVEVDRELFAGRRRAKNETELRGIRNAQRACEAALDEARALMRKAQPGDGGLEVDGEPLTSELLKRTIEGVFMRFDVEGSDMIVSHGPQTAVGHDEGSGQLQPNEPIVFDLFPRDKATGCYADMTRTYVVGEPSGEVQEWHRLVKEALERSTAEVRPGVTGRALFELVCELFQEAGYKTALNKEPGEVLEDGFVHSLGHGVGLEVHELPSMGRSGQELVPGDVITIEPGLYRAGYGGLRLEDLLVVTPDGYELLTQYPYELHP